ncbi:MAG: LacI family DNA-binding transcriptional regulator [Anaerolineales bacterium]|nr:LacI family DNA-binding transcriptional regulator [Anaerolineales bacterium]
MEEFRKRPTIKEVAAVAEVSTQTVSRVINNRPDVADETRERVKRVINEMGYRPSALARSLIRNRSYTIGVVTAGLKYIGPSRILNGITCTAEEAGYSLILQELPRFTVIDFMPVFNNLLSRHVDGIIWAAPEIGNNRDWVDDAESKISVPIVYMTMETRKGISIISVDNCEGARLAVSHLLDNGYRHIGHIAGPLEWWESKKRFMGWRETLMAAGYSEENCHWVEGNWSSSSGAEAARKLLDQYPDMDAVFSANDQMALGAMSVIHARGLTIPEDIAIAGFDNMPESEFFWPPLTTIQHDQHQAGALAVQEIIRLIESLHNHTAPEAKANILIPEIIVRQSSPRR